MFNDVCVIVILLYICLAEEASRLGNMRILVLEANKVINNPEAEICSTDTAADYPSDYHLLIRTGKHTQQCVK